MWNYNFKKLDDHILLVEANYIFFPSKIHEIISLISFILLTKIAKSIAFLSYYVTHYTFFLKGVDKLNVYSVSSSLQLKF